MIRFIALAALLAAGAVFAAPPAMRPGLWEISTSTEMSGMPQAIPSTKSQHCYKAEDVKDLRKTVPANKPNCKMSDWKESGKTVSWQMSCGGEMPTTMSGRVTYGQDRFSGVNQMTMNHGGQVMNMTQKYDGRRLGDCK